jgi:hypothetical protein
MQTVSPLMHRVDLSVTASGRFGGFGKECTT